MIALSGPATFGLILAAVVGLGFAGALVLLTLRRRGDQGPDIPPGMRPGPADEVLERRHVERVTGWGIMFVALIAIWLPGLWLLEPDQNVDDAIELISKSTERGETWFQEANEENPTGFGCARCHGSEAEGGSVAYTTPDGEFIPDYPVPKLSDVCGGPNTGHPSIKSVEDIRTTIEEGREGTPMPSWSIRFAGPMNDQQVSDLINYLVSIQDVPEEQNVCTNPEAAAAAQSGEATEEQQQTDSDAEEPAASNTDEGSA